MIVDTLCLDILLNSCKSITLFRKVKSARNVFLFSCGSNKQSTESAWYWSGCGIAAGGGEFQFESGYRDGQLNRTLTVSLVE